MTSTVVPSGVASSGEELGDGSGPSNEPVRESRTPPGGEAGYQLNEPAEDV